MDTQFDLDRLPDVFASQTDVRLAYLFGSQVGGQLGPLSDHDFGVLINPTAELGIVQARLAHHLAQVLQTDRVDVVVLNRAPLDLAYAIIAQGKVMYQRTVVERVEYEAYILGRYGDYLPILRAQQRDVVQGGRYENRVQRYRAALGRVERTLGEIRAAQRQATR
jgi:predicted nucleotidyltransferase